MAALYAGGEAGLDIHNPQSYPNPGGNWTVHFNTSGRADLKITPVEGTRWGVDLELVGIYCNGQRLEHQWKGKTAVVDSYQCDGKGWEVSRVLSTGRHALRLDFGGETEKAHNLASYLKMEWSKVEDVDGNWRQVTLTQEYESPVVVTSMHYESAGVPTVTRIVNVSSDGFQLKLQNPGDLSTPTTRDVSYLVVEEGNWTLPDGRTLEAQLYNSTQTDAKNDWTPVEQGYLNSYTNPVVLGQVMTHNDSRWSTFWASDGTQSGEPSSTSIHTGKHVSEDTETSRNHEAVGFVVVEEGHGTIKGTEYDFFLSGTNVQGVGDSPPYYEALGSSFPNAPQVALASPAGFNGGDGGWQVLYGTSNSTHVSLSLDEDQISDDDRGHVAENVAVFAFNQSGSYVDNQPGEITNPRFNTTQILNGEVVRFRVNVTDVQGPNTTVVNATFRYPHGELTNMSLVNVGYPVWEANWTDTEYPGRYNVTDIYTWDGIGFSHKSYNDTSFYVNDAQPLYWQDNSTNQTLAGWPVEHRVRWTDASGLSGYVFSWFNGANWTLSDSSGDLETGEVQKQANSYYTEPTNTQGESGTTTLSTGQTSKLVRLGNSYNLSKTFLVARHHGAASGTTDSIVPDVHTGTVRLVNGSYLRINRYSGTGYDSRATWSVLQADNIRVWNLTNNWASGDYNDDVTLPTALPSDYREKCFVELWRNTRVNSTDGECFAAGQVVSNITGTTTVNLRRDTESGNCPTPPRAETVGHVVCFEDNTTVQTGELSFGGASSSDTITAVNRSNAWLTFDFMVDNNGLQQVSMRGNLTADDTAYFTRETSTGSVTLRYYVVEFTGGQGFVEREGGNVGNGVTQEDWTFSRSYSDSNTLAVCSENFNSGTGTAFPRVWWTAYWVNDYTIRQNRGRTGTSSQSSDHVCQAVQWPDAGRHMRDDVEAASIWTNYMTVLPGQLVRVTSLNFTLNISHYDSSGSTQRGNRAPNVQLQAYNGTGWVEVGNFSVSGTGNASLATTDRSILDGWTEEDNRDFRVRAVDLDYYDNSNKDAVNWTGAWVRADSTQDFLNDSWVPLTGNGDWSNVTKVVNSTEGATVRWRVYANDSIGVWNVTDTFQYQALVDDEAPWWSGNQSQFPATYSPSELSQFNVTWQEELLEVDTVLFELNHSGSPKNYTGWQLGSEHGYNLTLPAGTHYWRSWANDTLGNTNVTDAWTIHVDRADPGVNTLLDGTDGNHSAPYYTSVELRVELGITGVVELHVDGASEKSGVAPVTKDKSFGTLGPHNVTGLYGGSQNYTSNYEPHWLTIWGESRVDWISPVNGEGTPGDSVSLLCNVSDATLDNALNGYPVDFWVDDGHLGTSFSNASGLASYTWDTTGYSAGDHTVKCNITDNSTLYYNDSATNQGSSTYTLVTLGTPSLSVLSPDLLIGKGNPDDNATISCAVDCSGGSCEGLRVGLQYQNASGWQWVGNQQLLINATNPLECGTAGSCSGAWDVEGLVNDSFQLRCNASSTFPGGSQVSGTDTLSVFVGRLSVESWTPASDPYDTSIYGAFDIDPVVNCTAPENTKAGCGPVTMVARTNQTGSAATDRITGSTDLQQESGSSWQTYGASFPSVDGGHYEIPFAPLTVNMTVGGNGDVMLYDVKVNSSDEDVAELDPTDREVRGHTGQLSVAIYETTTSANKTFEILYNLSCSGYRCLDVSLYPRYNASSASADTLAPTSPSPDAYNVSQQPYVTLGMEAGESLVDQIVSAFSAAAPGLWRMDLLANSSYEETSEVDAADANLEVTEIRITANLSKLEPDTVLERGTSEAVGSCNCTGGTCQNTDIYVQYYDGTWLNVPTGSSGKLQSNVTSYSLGDLSGGSPNYPFNLTGLVGGDHDVRTYCTSDQDSAGADNITLYVDDYPEFSNFAVNASVVYGGQKARFSVDVQDEAGVAEANFTIDGTKYAASQGPGDQWHYDWACSASDASVDWTLAEAQDAEGYYNSSAPGVSTECDAQAPGVEEARINDSSIVNIDTVVKVNASITDPEGNLDSVVLEVDRPVSGDYNQTPSVSGSEYYHALVLDEEGLWRFRFYASDTGGQTNRTVARDGNGNDFINAMDTENPSVSQVAVNATISRAVVKLNASVTDNVAVDTVLFRVNGTNYTQTGSSGDDWFHNWHCTENGYYLLEEVWANDTSDNWDWESAGLDFFCDTDAPTYTGAGQNASNPGEGELVGVHALWNNVYADLGTATLRTNETGLWQDRQYHTFSNKPEWSNFTLETAGKVGETICWRIWANNSLGTLNDTMPQTCFHVEDSTPPTFTLASDDSGGQVGEGELVKAQALWDDDVVLGTAVLRTDRGGAWSNDSYWDFTDTPQYSEFNISTTGHPNQTICWQIWANDTTGNWNTSMASSCFFVEDVTAPTFSSDGDDSGGEVEAGQLVGTSAYWDDDVALSYAIFRTTETGDWAEQGTHRFDSKPEWSNFSIETTGIGGRTVCWQIRANDTTGNLNTSMTSHCFFVNDTVPPAWQDNSTTPTVADVDVEHRVHWRDTGGLSGYVFAFDNCTGSLVNDSWTPLSGTAGWTNVTKHVNDTIGCTARWKVYLNDSMDNWNATGTFSYETLENHPPKWSQNSTNLTLAGWPVEHRLHWQDDSGLSGYVFAFHNGSNLSWTNESANQQPLENSVTATGRWAEARHVSYHEQFDFTTSLGTSTYRPIGATINTTNAFLLMYTAGPSSDPDNWLITGHIYNETHVLFERTASDSVAYVSWFVVENAHDPDHEVMFKTQRGEVNLPAGDVTGNATINIVNTSRSMVLGQCRIEAGATTDDSQDGYATLELHNSTMVRVERASTATGSSATCRYEVVEFTESSGVTVQTGETTLSSTNPLDVDVQLFNASSSLLYHTWDATNNGLQQVSIYGQLVDSDTIRFGRYGSTSYTNQIRWYLVDFPQDAVARADNYNWDPQETGTVHRDNAISPAVNRSRAVIVHSSSTSGTGTAFARNKNLPYFLDQTASGDNWRESQYHGDPDDNYDQHETRAQLFTLPYREGKYEDNETNKTHGNYGNVLQGKLFESITNITVTLQVTSYNNSGSSLHGNRNPDLWVDVYNGSGWVSAGKLGVDGTGNFSLSTQENSVRAAWSDTENRDVRVTGTYFDYNLTSHRDSISYDGLWVEVDSEREFLNDSWVPLSDTSDWATVTKVVNWTAGTTVRWRVYSNDSIDNWNSTPVFTYQTQEDSEAPAWSKNSTNDTTAGYPVEHRIFWQDNAALSGYVFAFDNCTGSLVNDSWKPLSGASGWVNVTKHLNSTPHCTVRWKVYVNDSWGGLWNATDTFEYGTELKADLRVGRITLNNSDPNENEAVRISANVSNHGRSPANQSAVWFNSTDANGVQHALGSVSVDLAVGQWQVVNLTASFGQGGHTVNVSARTHSSVVELDWSDNWNTTSLEVPVWAYFHGNVTGRLMLAISGDTSTFEWEPSQTTGNVFFMDYDSGVDFTDVRALNGTDDFHQLDLALGTENFTDSVNRTYDSDGDGQADQTASFDIYGATVTGVPVVQAADGSPWQVGILWDGEDGGTGYTGEQDVIFITRIDPGTQGAFGISDYEARVPSNLKQLRGQVDLIATRLGVE